MLLTKCLLVLLLCCISSQFIVIAPPDDAFAEYSEFEADTPVYYMRHRRASRMCGDVLTKAMQAVCNNCVKPPGSSVFEKRSDFWRPKREEKVTDKCCKEKCTMDYLKKFCC